MHFNQWVIQALKQDLKSLVQKIRASYLTSKIRCIEFFLSVILLLSLSYFQKANSVPYSAKAFVGQIQAFVAFYLAFRFGYLGLIYILVLSTFDFTAVIYKYWVSNDATFMIAIVVKSFTVITSIIVAILSNNQEKNKKRFQKLAVTDELTDVYNQRFFHSALETKLESAQKNQKSIGLILIDIDNFKTYNDIFGHDCGDAILKGTASLLKAIFKEDSLICRYGGDEFAIIMEANNLQSIECRVKQIQLDYEKLKRDYYTDDFFNKVTLSMGLSEFPNKSGSKGELITQADMALYHAKNLGKDKLHFYQDVILQLRRSIKSDNQQLIGIFKGLLSTISVKDKYTLGHCERVSSYAVMIGEAISLPIKEISILQYAGLLHDIGKIEMPKSVLNKLDKLSDDEKELIQKHPLYSANILESLEGMEQLIDYVIHHHEKFDGTGYPHGLTGKRISLGARILCVADCFDAMISERPYSKSMSMKDAVEELEQCAGSHFDPEIVKAFVSVLNNKPKESIIHPHTVELVSSKMLA